ncbi:MAG TPA: hypothetical protein VGJ03_02520 [Acidimicrobiales bacterium]
MAESFCPRCRGRLVTIALPLDGRDLVMQSCSRCDLRLWQDRGEEVELTEVLGRELARQPALR